MDEDFELPLVKRPKDKVPRVFYLIGACILFGIAWCAIDVDAMSGAIIALLLVLPMCLLLHAAGVEIA